jgi:hypothetical protein
LPDYIATDYQVPVHHFNKGILMMKWSGLLKIKGFKEA